MVRDPLVQKAWELRQHAECFPVEIMLKATAWLEEKHQQALQAETAIAIALQYMVLAMRRVHPNPTLAKKYFSRARHWREEAQHWIGQWNQFTSPQSRN